MSKIDAVIAWVDGSDPDHRAKREKFSNTPRPPSQYPVTETRFSSMDEVYFCILAIRKNLPWINRIVLITDDQKPAFLDESFSERWGVTVVDHKVIFTGFHEVLPTFNAITIETVLHRIPELSDRFIYFNDDFMVIKPMTESDYFDGNRPRIRGLTHPSNRYLRRLDRAFRPNRYIEYGYVGIQLGSETIPKLRKIVKLAHTPHPVNRNDYATILGRDKRLEKNIKYRFRDRKQFGPLTFYANWGLKNELIEIVPRDELYIHPDRYGSAAPGVLANLIFDSSQNHICIQSLDEFSRFQQGEILQAMAEKLDVDPI